MKKRIPFRIDIFERAFKRFQRKTGGSFASLAKEMKVPVAQLREWRRLGELPTDKLTVMAGVLGVEASRLQKYENGEIPHAASALSPQRVGHNLLTVARTFRSYTRFLGTRREHHQFPHRKIIHHGGESSFYATFFLEPSAHRQEWLFSIWFGVRMDYGYVRMLEDGRVELDPILQVQEETSRNGFVTETDDGLPMLAVRTWFGRSSCDYVVQSRDPFELRRLDEPAEVPGCVTFIRNPFQKDE